MEVPDLYNILVNHPHIKIDSPTTEEEIQKVVHRFSQSVSVSSSKGHMTHTDVYCAILDVVVKVCLSHHITCFY